MNVFACHLDPTVSATWLADQHVVKMVTETAQILSTALHENGITAPGLYKPTHKNHPCVVSAKNDPGYFSWSARHGLSLAGEYQVRFGKTHSALAVIQKALELAPESIQTPRFWPLAMPEEFKTPDPHESYRRYLNSKYDSWAEKGGRYAPRWRRVVDGNPFYTGAIIK